MDPTRATSTCLTKNRAGSLRYDWIPDRCTQTRPGTTQGGIQVTRHCPCGQTIKGCQKEQHLVFGSLAESIGKPKQSAMKELQSMEE